MGGKDGSPGSRTFTPLRLAVGIGCGAIFLGTVLGMAWLADQSHSPDIMLLALVVPFFVAAGTLWAGGRLIDVVENRGGGE